jgi:dCMP deaminase
MPQEKNHRPSWDDYFIDIMHMVGKRSTCDLGYVGSVIVKDNRILTTGYAGSPVGVGHCTELGHEMHTVTHPDGTVSEHCIRTIHAEQNALITAAKHGISTVGGTLYCKMTPCYTCAKLIINAGIVRVVAQNDYHASARSKEIFTEAGILFELIHHQEQSYE